MSQFTHLQIEDKQSTCHKGYHEDEMNFCVDSIETTVWPIIGMIQTVSCEHGRPFVDRRTTFLSFRDPIKDWVLSMSPLSVEWKNVFYSYSFLKLEPAVLAPQTWEK
jgi:hypothetical protein